MRQIFLILLVHLTFVASAIGAPTLLIQFSDTHSNYANVPNFIKSVTALSEDFMMKHPDGHVILMANGDIVGANVWTEFDGGDLTYWLLAGMSTEHKIVFTIGNHEAFDFVGTVYEQGMPRNGLFLKQASELVRVVEKHSLYQPSFKILAANAVPTQKTSHLFGSSTDFKVGNNQTLRIVGLTLPDLMRYSAYDKQSELQIFQKIGPLLGTAQEELKKAAQDGVGQVIFQCHADTKAVNRFAEALLRWKKTEPSLQKVEIPFIGAAHDHLESLNKIDQTYVIDAGSDFAFTTAILDETSKVQKIHHWTVEAQKAFKYFNRLTFVKKTLVDLFETEVEKVSNYSDSSSLIGEIKVPLEGKREISTGRTPTGDRLAQALVNWGLDAIRAEGVVPSYVDVVSFFNSSGFRKMSPTEPGMLSAKDISEMVPFKRKLRLLFLSGEDIETLFGALRRHRKQDSKYSPQMPNYINEGKYGHELYVRNERIRLKSIYALVLDDFLGANGYGLREFDEVFMKRVWEISNTPTTQEVMMKYLCDTLLLKSH